VTLQLKQALADHRPVVGCWHAIQDPAVTETLRDIDLDFLTFDQQHVATNIQTLQQSFIALRPTKMATLVRMLRNDTADIGQVLDAGADGVIVPMVNTEQEALRAVQAAKYPPEGIRSWGPRRAALKYTDADAYTRNANGSIVIAQIETVEAVSNLDAILSVPGLDAVMIGPGDLAISLGYMSDLNHPAAREVFQSVLDRCLHHGVPFGIFTASVSDALDWIERGALIVNCYADAVFVTDGMSAMASQFAKARAESAHSGEGR
jgi:2-keto-3-deoxy-L-rhamnonate aldolase RhmA